MVSSGNQDDDSREREEEKNSPSHLYTCMHTTCRNVGYGNS